MEVFVTGATGFIGSFLVPELIAAGHQVLGLSRSEKNDALLLRAGAEVYRGDVNDPESLKNGVASADAVIHAAFNHDFTAVKQSSDNDRKVIETLGEALKGSDRPLLITSGTALVKPQKGSVSTETDAHYTSKDFPRASTEEAADAVKAGGVNVIVMRLSQVHNAVLQGRISEHVKLAKQKGFVAYVGEGQNRVPAVHVQDTAHLFRLALEKRQAGAHYHAVAEEGVCLRDIAEAIGAGFNIPVKSLTPDEAKDYFGWMAPLAAADLAASSTLTRQQLSWQPTGPGLLEDLRNMDYSKI